MTTEERINKIDAIIRDAARAIAKTEAQSIINQEVITKAKDFFQVGSFKGLAEVQSYAEGEIGKLLLAERRRE